VRCRACLDESAAFATATVRGRHRVRYFRCGACGFIQTEEPYWLDEAYAQPINESDIGIVSRNASLARVCQGLILAFFDPNATFLDHAGGYGLFTRAMRDAGFDFRQVDAFCPNLFARGFEAPAGDVRYEMVTAFELLEHVADPRGELRRLRALSGNLLLSTVLVPPEPPLPEAWWYYGLDHGQHISFYTPRSLAILAGHCGLRLYSEGSLHLMTEGRLSPAVFRTLVRNGAAAEVLRRFLRRRQRKRSLLAEDYEKLTGRPLA
jgi:hypothetical protein